MKFAKVPALLVALIAAIGASAVQGQNSGMVSVDLREVAATIAQRSGLDESQMPLSIQVPADVAAAVCGVPLGPMAQQAARGGEGCTARTSTPELERVVARRMKADEAPAAPSRSSSAPGD